jgi:predicted ATPase/DNA-binding CsgD family transcriptional regulator
MTRDDHLLTTLPAPRSSFLGREDELQEVLALTRDQSLVTVVGPGGIGKTRLALALAHQLAEQGARVGFVELADVAGDNIVLEAIADQLAVEVAPRASRHDGVMHLLASGPTVLVIDNFEHVIGAAPEVANLLEQCPELRVVVTSRRPLRVADEHVLSLPPLAATSSDQGHIAPGVELLLERSHTDSVLPADLATASRIVDGLGGLPLAIELAARRVRSLGFAAVYELLVADLALDGFRTEPQAPERHSSLRNCLDWTYRDLDESARSVLRATGAFAGTFDLAALQAVVDDRRRAATGLATLVEHSFVQRSETADGSVRYTSIPPIREFARELLSSDVECAATIDAHVRWYASVASRIRERFERTDAEASLSEFRRESPNISRAIGSLYTSGRYAESLAVACDVAKIAVELGREGRVNEWFAEAVAAARAQGVEPPYEAQVWAAYAELMTIGPGPGERPTAGIDDIIARAQAAGDDRAVLRGLERITYSVMAHGDLFRGLAASQEAVELSARLGFKWHHAQLSILRAMGLHVIGDIAEASRLGFEGLRIARALKAPRLVVRVGLLFAPMTRTAEMDTEQVPSLEACYAIARECGSALDEMYVVMQLAVGAGFEGDAKVFEFARDGFALADRTRSSAGELVFTLALAGAALTNGDDEIADALDRGLRLQWTALLPVIPKRALDHYERIVEKHRATVGSKAADVTAETSTTRWSDTLAIARNYASRSATGPTTRGGNALTDRELQVLAEIAAGSSNKQIAEALGIRPKTVMHHCSAIFRKLGVKTRTEAVATALRSGLLHDQSV